MAWVGFLPFLSLVRRRTRREGIIIGVRIEGKSGVGEEEKAREGQRKAGFDASDATKKKEGRL